MGECCGGEEETDYDPSNAGPNSKRRCTDVPCLLLLITFIGAWIGVGFYSFSFGNPAQLIHPSNSEGEICGRGIHQNKPFLLFFDLTRCAKVSAVLGCPTPQVCVAKCPTDYWSYKQGAAATTGDFCTGLTPGELGNSRNISVLVKQRKCPAYLLPSRPFLHRCIPGLTGPEATTTRVQGLQVNQDKVKEGVEHVWEAINVKGYGEKLLADLALDWWVLLVAVVAACALSFIWIVLLQLAAGVIVYSTIIICCLLLVAVTCFAFYKYFEDISNGQTYMDDVFAPPGLDKVVDYYFDHDTWLTIGILMGVITLVIVLVLLFLRKRLMVAVKLLEEASCAVKGSCSTLIFPILPFLLQLVILLWFLGVASCLATAGEKEFRVIDACDSETCSNPQSLVGAVFQNGDTCSPASFPKCTSCPKAQCVFFKYGPTTLNSWFQVLNLVGLFWLLFFLGAMGEMIMAGAFAEWYWTRDKSTVKSTSSLGTSIGRTFRYHLGSLAFGSLILSAIRMVRVLLEWLEEKLKRHGVADNPGVKFVMCCCKCCLWCLEKFIRYMNRNAYIMTAVYGYSFCKAGRKSFKLLISNAVRAGTLDRVTDFVLFLGKVIVVTLVTLGAYFSLEKSTDIFATELNYKFAPLLAIMVITYAIASCFFSVYSMAVDTIFLCFLEDLDRHKGGPYFMGEDLKNILDLKEYRKSAIQPLRHDDETEL